jgi:hypothetical protein
VVDRLDAALRGLDGGRAPALGARAEAMLRALSPVRPASRFKELAVVAGASLVMAAAGVLASGDAHDAAEGAGFSLVPRTLHVGAQVRQVSWAWLAAVGLGWSIGFVACLTAAMMPGRRSMLPDPLRATLAMLVGPAAMVAFGATLAGWGAGPLPSWQGELRHGLSCLFTGLETAAVPFLGGAFVLRNTLPIDTRAVGAALGAAGGALGALALHLRCGSGGMHVAVAHGGAAVVGALLGGAILPRIVRS